MSAELRSFMEAYNAVHSQEAREDLYAKMDEISEMDLSLISDVELGEIAEEALQDLFSEGFSVIQANYIFDNLIAEAKVTYGHDTQSARQAKVQRLKGALKGAVDKAKSKSARSAVAAYGAYRSAKLTADDIRRRTSQTAKNISAQTARKASEAKTGVKTGLKGLIKKTAERIASKASKVANKMNEEYEIQEGIKSALAGAGLAASIAAQGMGGKPAQKYRPSPSSGSQVTKTAPVKSGSEAWAKANPGLAAKEASKKKPASVKSQLSDIRDMIARSKARQQSESLQVSEAKKGDGNLANNYPPYGKVTRGDVIAGALGKDQMGGKKKKNTDIEEATAMAKRGYDEAPIRQRIAKSTGGGKAADRASALEKKSTFGDSSKQKQRERYARAQRGDFRKTTSSSPGLSGYAHKSDDAGVKAKQAARGAQRGALTPAEKKQFNREEFDIFDMILEFLQAEGFVETLEEAEWMMANIIDEEAIAIITESSCEDGEDEDEKEMKKGKKSKKSEKDDEDEEDDDDDLKEASYSAKAARAGKDIGKPGKAFAKIAKSAAKRYGSKERGEKVAGAVLAKLRREEFGAWLDEAMTNYEKNRKRAAQRAAARNEARAQGKTGAVPGVGYVTPRKERETWTDESGKTRHAKGL